MSVQLPVESLNMENEESRTPESNSNEMETSKKILDQLENRLSVEDIMKIQKVFMVGFHSCILVLWLIFHLIIN